MFLSIRQYVIEKPEHVIKAVDKELLPKVKAIPGFINFYALVTGGRLFATVSVFETHDGMEKSDSTAVEWIHHYHPDLFPNPPQETAGEVRLHS